jgi:hypothetical protein
MKMAMEGIALPPSKGEIICTNLPIGLASTLAVRLKEHSIKRIGSSVSNQIVSGSFHVNSSLIQGDISLSIGCGMNVTSMHKGIFKTPGSCDDIVLCDV